MDNEPRRSQTHRHSHRTPLRLDPLRNNEQTEQYPHKHREHRTAEPENHSGDPTTMSPAEPEKLAEKIKKHQKSSTKTHLKAGRHETSLAYIMIADENRKKGTRTTIVTAGGYRARSIRRTLHRNGIKTLKTEPDIPIKPEPGSTTITTDRHQHLVQTTPELTILDLHDPQSPKAAEEALRTVKADITLGPHEKAASPPEEEHADKQQNPASYVDSLESRRGNGKPTLRRQVHIHILP